MTTLVTIKRDYPYLGDQYPKWGYEFEVNISSQVMDNPRYYTIGPDLRLKQPFMDGILDAVYKLDPANKLVPGERGPDIMFQEFKYGFQTSDAAISAADMRYNEITKELRRVYNAVKSKVPYKLDLLSYG